MRTAETITRAIELGRECRPTQRPLTEYERLWNNHIAMNGNGRKAGENNK